MNHWTDGRSHVFTGLRGGECGQCGQPAYALVITGGVPVILCSSCYGGAR